MPVAAAAELIAIAPCRHLGPQGASDPHQHQSFAQLGEPDVVGRHAKASLRKQALGFFDRLPALLEWREVPALALPADNPKPPLRCVERETSADRKMLDDFVATEI